MLALTFDFMQDHVQSFLNVLYAVYRFKNEEQNNVKITALSERFGKRWAFISGAHLEVGALLGERQNLIMIF